MAQSDKQLMSRPFKPVRCCENCVFGRGPHADWCEKQFEYGTFEIALEAFADALLKKDIKAYLEGD